MTDVPGHAGGNQRGLLFCLEFDYSDRLRDMFIVTAGQAFNDIDAFAGCIAYAHLLRLEGREAEVVFVGPLNHSVTQLAYQQSSDFLTEYSLKPEDQLVYIDLSGPENFAFAGEPEGRIAEIYDHHYGFEQYWIDRLGERSHIERVGAVATLIWEEYVKRGKSEEILSSDVNLLLLAILQNTLNFTAPDTNERDRAAFDQLLARSTLPADWQQTYWRQATEAIEQDFVRALKDDTKVFSDFASDRSLVFSQLELGVVENGFFERHRPEIDQFWAQTEGAIGLLNLSDVARGRSIVYCSDRDWLRSIAPKLGVDRTDSDGGWVELPITQRKKILAKIQ